MMKSELKAAALASALVIVFAGPALAEQPQVGMV